MLSSVGTFERERMTNTNGDCRVIHARYGGRPVTMKLTPSCMIRRDKVDVKQT